MGSRFRLLVNEVDAVKPEHELPKLPVARVLWKPRPDMYTGCAAWIYAGGAHHTCYSQNLNSEHLEDFAEMMDIEFVHLTVDTTTEELKKELRVNDLLWKLSRLGPRMCAVPLVLHYDRKPGPSKMNVSRTIWRTIGLLLKRRVGL